MCKSGVNFYTYHRIAVVANIAIYKTQETHIQSVNSESTFYAIRENDGQKYWHASSTESLSTPSSSTESSSSSLTNLEQLHLIFLNSGLESNISTNEVDSYIIVKTTSDINDSNALNQIKRILRNFFQVTLCFKTNGTLKRT
jgi:hypothetical protein